MRTAVLGFLVAAALVFVLTPLMSRLAHRTGAVDTPTDGRRMHEMAMPLLGGLGIYLAWMVSVMVFVKIDRPVWGIIGGATIVVAVGLFDDLYELEPIVKFIGQLLAIGVAIYFDIHISRIGIPFTHVMWYLHPVLSVAVTAFWMAMIINMVNFIDGLDGLAAGVCGISALTFCIISLSTNFPAAGVIAAILAGATFAFLRFNFHPATIFMGDAGSMLLGFVLACLSVQSVMKGTAAIALVLPLLVLGVPFVDLFLIVWRRWQRGVPFYSAGQDHVHHDLVLVHGFSQRKSVLLLYSWCILLSGLAIAIQRESPWGKILLGIAATVATVYMLQLLSRYRSRNLGLPDPLAPGVGNNPPPAEVGGGVADAPSPGTPAAGAKEAAAAKGIAAGADAKPAGPNGHAPGPNGREAAANGRPPAAEPPAGARAPDTGDVVAGDQAAGDQTAGEPTRDPG